MVTRILIVEDDASSRGEMIRILKASDPFYEIWEAPDGLAGLAVLADVAIDLIIADLVMPRMDGLKLLAAVRSDERFTYTPFIIVTSRANIEEKLLSFERGAQDFLTKPFHPDELVARVRVMLTFRAHLRSLQQQAVVDTLTGLYNHNYLMAALQREIKRSQRHDLNISCLMIDVDDFKSINDMLGHLAGDEVLRTIGGFLQSTLRGYDFAVRYGGDEFLVVLAQNTTKGALAVAERIREVVAQYTFFPRHLPPNPVRVTVGVASAPAAIVKSPDMIVRAADQALYRAKLAGKNQVCVASFSRHE